MRVILGFGLFACLLVVGFIVYRNSHSTDDVKPPALVPTGPTKGYVAAVDIPARGALTQAVVMEKEEPKGLNKEIVTTAKDLEGFVVRDEVKAGQPILKTNSLGGKIRPTVLEHTQSSGRMLAISNVEISQKAGSQVALPIGTRLRAKVGPEATVPAGAKPGKAVAMTALPKPIFVTLLFASSPGLDGPQLWDTRPSGEEAAAGRDLLIAATPADAMEIGRAARDRMLGFEKAESVAGSGIQLSVLMRKPEMGKRLIDIDDALRVKVTEEKRKQREEEQTKIEAERQRIRAERAQFIRNNKAMHTCSIGNPRCGRWTTRLEPVEREVDVYKGRELTKVKLTDATRTVQEWVWYPGHSAGNVSSTVATLAMPPVNY